MSRAPSSTENARAGVSAAPAAGAHPAGDPNAQQSHTQRLLPLSVAALGVVYGDIGTSPLYAVRECFQGAHRVPPTHDNVLGVLSLVVWALIIVVSLKYLLYVMQANDNGEGGIMALMGLASARSRRSARIILMLGLFGSGLLFGDAVITPAISVLSAVEGLEVATPRLQPYVVPVTVAVLIVLFSFQRRGTAKVGAVFGPVIVLWFFAIGTFGMARIVDYPAVFHALNPVYGIRLLQEHGFHAFLVLGAVVLVVTGGEALYADMGHFGLRPIRITWYALVLPALLLNYFGQGALILVDPDKAHNPFYGVVPAWALLPMVALATAATVIASQAVISGVFSLTRQAIMLGFWPRAQVNHTSDTLVGQIYVPGVNWALMLATIALVLSFKASTNLANAYGIAVTGTMTITTVLAFVVALRQWRWSPWLAGLVTAALLVVDLAFLSANAVKILAGGWLPLAIALLLYVLMTTWRRGREALGKHVRSNLVPLDDFWELIRIERPARVPGTAVFMTSNLGCTPLALLHNFIHNRVVHDHVILLTVTTLGTARVPAHQKLVVEDLGHHFVRIQIYCGFMEKPDVPALLQAAHLPGFRPDHTTYFLGREALISESAPGVGWRIRVFSAMSRNALGATSFYAIPPDRVFEVGSQLQLSLELGRGDWASNWVSDRTRREAKPTASA
ncbi:MAG: potassium transporter Kup [Polyangiaceae bacterium]|nr:potassium transporter Kup [Polyangiaceae bacterium]